MSDLSTHDPVVHAAAHTTDPAADQPHSARSDAEPPPSHPHTTDPAPHQPLSAADWAKDAVAIAGGIGAVCYALGFITVSLFLQSWSIYDISLLSGRYISVGFCMLVFCTIGMAPSYYFFRALLDPRPADERGLREKTSLSKWAVSAAICLFGPAAASFVIAMCLCIQLLSNLKWDDLLGSFSFLIARGGALFA